MSASGWTLVFSLLTPIAVVSGTLTAPTGARLSSTNMDLVFRWKPPDGAPSGLTYSTRYRSFPKNPGTEFRTGCVKISTLECDLTPFNISAYGKYSAEVRAELGEQRSEWVPSNEITLDRETTIGSPRVSLLSLGANLEVGIKDPVFRVSTLRNVYTSVAYNIAYWKKNQETKGGNLTHMQQNRVVLDKLDPWSEYCVQVQIHTIKNPNPSRPSDVICESTGGEKEAPWVAALVVFVVMAVMVALVVVVVLRWKRISQFLFPKHVLPEYFKESILAPPTSSVYFPVQNLLPVEELNHQVDVVPSNKILEEGSPLEAAESSCSDQLKITVENRVTVHKHMSEETLLPEMLSETL